MRDIILYCENLLKITDQQNFFELGELQMSENGINIGFTIDGTKDSAKMTVLSYDISHSIKPYSIIYHPLTNSWWIVAKDNVDRYENESGYLYKHNLELEGAIELLNARDLTDCGFNQNKYTLEQLIQRLFKLSNFEITNISILSGNNIDLTMLIDYVKTYENYTLLSALRDVLSGYNCSAQLRFNIENNYVDSCTLVIIPKTGNIDLPVLDSNEDFNIVDEKRSIHKSSYGTTIVSNTDNVVSTITKQFPSVGGTKLVSKAYNVTATNAMIKLPTKAFDVEEVCLHLTIRMGLRTYYAGDWHYEYANFGGYFNTSDEGSIRHALTVARTYMRNNYGQFNNTDFGKKFNSIVQTIQKMGTVRIKKGAEYNPISRRFSYPDGSPVIELDNPYGSAFVRYQTVLLDREFGTSIAAASGHEANALYSRPENVIKWDRGSDEITGFDFLSSNLRVRLTQTEYKTDSCVLYGWTQGGNSTQLIIAASERTSGYSFTQNTFGGSQTKHSPLFSVKYIPMTDIKIKLDNRGDDNNTHLYNQNGKLTDINAFSKLLNSYKKEIEGENIIKHSVGYDFNTMPKIGQIVNDDNLKYVINSVSYNLFENEESDNYPYFIVGEFSLSESSSIKSLLTNPNTNIRDYGIPQKNNIARKQVYRDFYELTFEMQHNENDYYQPLNKIVNFSADNTTNYQSHAAIFKLTYSREVNGNTQYYYTLESTVYKMKKAVYEIIEFKDNNIIGYDAQNTTTGFAINRVFTGTYELMNIPISYVDSAGEFKDIDICFCSAAQVQSIYQQYKETTAYADNDTIAFQNLMLFLPEEIYTLARTNNDFVITENDYNKDALEVPVFEYCCQIDDTEDVEIGEDILENENAILVLYDFAIVPKNTATQLNAKKFFRRLEHAGDTYTSDIYDYDVEIYSRDVQISIENNRQMKLRFFYNQTVEYLFNADSTVFVQESKTTSGQVLASALADKDIVIFKHLISHIGWDDDAEDSDVQYQDKLVMIIHGAQLENFVDNELTLNINHYKLK